MTKSIKSADNGKMRDQSRYNEYGTNRLRALQIGRITVQEGYEWRPLIHADILRALGPTLCGKHVLELGCGAGEFSVFCAKQGAIVTGVDIGLDLIAAAREWARINCVSCEFRQANIVHLPFRSNRYHIVIGLAVLHHLSEEDVPLAVAEAHRVLRNGGRAVFFEPVQNSILMKYVRNTLPQRMSSKYGHYDKPSIWQRKKWKQYVASLDDRYLTFDELIKATSSFSTVHLYPKNLFVIPEWFFAHGYAEYIAKLERAFIEWLPSTGTFCTNVLVECKKHGTADTCVASTYPSGT
jgi:2-polyprenyl-3-methyl-5-hydroxy-6-metoxy-1,4-benzoquinol methylase